MSTTVSYDDIAGLAGTDLGWSEWLEVTQDRVDLFADATDDHQWIHTDPERAMDGPFGGAIAHGFLSLSLAVTFWTELLDVAGVTTKVNYGLDKVRFISPVKVGARVRMNAVIAEVTEIAGGYQLAVDQTIQVDGGGKPAVVARGLYRFYA
ncbi:MaoC family dehydratase [Microbacterium sp. SL62]|uniref:MaoC family dehydratase n=1 Tax=Microbacterium sp. SL62 TaxID=2995139 RepID=UPI0022759DE6|nr:MaoC family dehydratase [Microbacterium sp. SL62]MCY1715356.1 MaoC family dehydratase [Microbacterium sp. SL62]